MTWDDYQEIGEALAETYPDANYLTISNEELIRLVLALPDFQGSATPDARDLSAVSFAWIAAAAGPDDSSPYERVAD